MGTRCWRHLQVLIEGGVKSPYYVMNYIMRYVNGTFIMGGEI